MHKHRLLFLFFLVSPLAFADAPPAQQALILDCAVTRANPLFNLADFPEGAAFALMEHYRFAIPNGGGAGQATTPRAKNIPVQVLESETHFQANFENKSAVIDRMTAEFQVFFRGAQQPFGSGTCTRLERRKF